MDNKENLVLGVNIGGSHIAVGFVDMDRRVVLQRSYFSEFVNCWGSAEEIIETWTLVIKKAFDAVDITDKRISIAMPGPFNHEAGICYIQGKKKYNTLYKLNVRTLLAEKLDIPIHNILMVNDAACFLNGEVFAGVAANHRKVIALTLGTGLGLAIYDNGTIIDTGLSNTTLNGGVAEDYLSSSWFLKTYFERTGINIGNVKELKEISSDSEAARYVFRQFATHLGFFLHPLIEREKPDIVIIGGNIARASAWFLPHLVVNLSKKNIHVPVRISRLGERASLLGAANYWANSIIA